MRDPAVEAARRVWNSDNDPVFWEGTTGWEHVTAAREALKPIRAELDHARDIASRGAAIEKDFYDLVEALSRHVYTTEELDNV